MTQSLTPPSRAHGWGNGRWCTWTNTLRHWRMINSHGIKTDGNCRGSLSSTAMLIHRTGITSFETDMMSVTFESRLLKGVLYCSRSDLILSPLSQYCWKVFYTAQDSDLILSALSQYCWKVFYTAQDSDLILSALSQYCWKVFYTAQDSDLILSPLSQYCWKVFYTAQDSDFCHLWVNIAERCFILLKIVTSVTFESRLLKGFWLLVWSFVKLVLWLVVWTVWISPGSNCDWLGVLSAWQPKSANHVTRTDRITWWRLEQPRIYDIQWTVGMSFDINVCRIKMRVIMDQVSREICSFGMTTSSGDIILIGIETCTGVNSHMYTCPHKPVVPPHPLHVAEIHSYTYIYIFIVIRWNLNRLCLFMLIMINVDQW